MIKNIFNSISNKEWLFLTGVIGLVLVITSAPILYAHLISGTDSVYIGNHYAALTDWYVYYSYIMQVKEGSFLLYDLYTSEPQLPMFNIAWLATGLLARLFNLSAPLAFYAMKGILIPVLIIELYLFISFLTQNKSLRKIAILVLTFSSGLGFLLAGRLIVNPKNNIGGLSWPMDLWVADHNVFFSSYFSPHFLLSLILMLAIYFSTAVFYSQKKYIYSVITGVSAALLFSFHPFHVISVSAALGMFFLSICFVRRKIDWRLILHGLIFTIISAPPVAYYLYILENDPVWLRKSIENFQPTTPLFTTLVSYGLLLPLAVIGLAWLTRNFKKLNDQKWTWLLIATWSIVSFICIYAPVNYQRRMILGVHLPMAILASLGILLIAGHVNKNIWLRKIKYFLITILIFGLTFSQIIVISLDVNIFQERLLNLKVEEINALEDLKKLDTDSIILPSYNFEWSAVPAFSGRTSYIGHGIETAFFQEKEIEANWFFSANRSEELERDFLTRRGITHIFYSFELEDKKNYDPTTKSYLDLVFQIGNYSTYEIK